MARAAAVAASVLVHVLVYGALSLAPAWTPPPRTGLVVTEVVLTEPPAPPTTHPEPLTPRPRLRPRPTKAALETPARPVVATPTTPPPPADPPPAAASPVDTTPTIAAPAVAERPPSAPAEPPRETTAASPAPAAAPSSEETPRAASAPDANASASAGPLAGAGAPAPRGGAAVAALPPASFAGAPGTVTRMAIPRGGYQVTPSYPASARRLGIEGTALLRVFVDSDGRVGDVVVKQSAGHPDLDRAAAEAVRRWRFEPARRGADTVAMWVELPVEFHLR